MILRHSRRKVVHFNVSSNPSAQWTAQQVVEAFPWETAPKYLMRDRDSIYGVFFRNRVKNILCSYFEYYHNDRTHLSLEKDSP